MVVQAAQALAEVDPDSLTPMCDEARFAELAQEMVDDEAPRLFAVVQEYGERADGRIAAWGMAFENCAKIFEVDRGLHLSLRSPERAMRMFSRRPHITARVVWVNPDIRVAAQDAAAGYEA